MHHLPSAGPVLLATNAEGREECLRVLAATDRTTRILWPPGNGGQKDWEKLGRQAEETLARGEVVALPVGEGEIGADRLLDQVAKEGSAPVLPVWYATAPSSRPERRGRVYVFGGTLLPPGTPADEVRQQLQYLGDEFRRRGREAFDAERALSAGIH
jgi:hypothetical protein